MNFSNKIKKFALIFFTALSFSIICNSNAQNVSAKTAYEYFCDQTNIACNLTFNLSSIIEDESPQSIYKEFSNKLLEQAIKSVSEKFQMSEEQLRSDVLAKLRNPDQEFSISPDNENLRNIFIELSKIVFTLENVSKVIENNPEYYNALSNAANFQKEISWNVLCYIFYISPIDEEKLKGYFQNFTPSNNSKMISFLDEGTNLTLGDIFRITNKPGLLMGLILNNSNVFIPFADRDHKLFVADTDQCSKFTKAAFVLLDMIYDERFIKFQSGRRKPLDLCIQNFIPSASIYHTYDDEANDDAETDEADDAQWDRDHERDEIDPANMYWILQGITEAFSADNNRR